MSYLVMLMGYLALGVVVVMLLEAGHRLVYVVRRERVQRQDLERQEHDHAQRIAALGAEARRAIQAAVERHK